MIGGLPIALHLAVHVLGVAVALGLAVGVVRPPRSPGWRTTALGALLLAAAHTAGGALVVGEAAWPLYLRAGGYAALALGAAASAATAPAPTAAAPPAGTAAVVVAAPLGAHLTTAAAGVLAAVAAVRASVPRHATPFAVGLLLWAAADLLARQQVTAAATLSVAGSLAVGVWVARGLRTSLWGRLVTVQVGVLVLLVVGLAAGAATLFSADLEQDQRRALTDQARAQATQFTEVWPEELLTTAGALAGDTLAAELAAGDAAVLTERARTLASGLPGVDVVLLTDRAGRPLASWDRAAGAPLAPADRDALAGDPILAQIAAGAPRARGVTVLGGRDLVAAAAAMVAPTEAGQPRLDRRTGAILLARRISDPRVVDQMAAIAGADATVVVAGEVAASTLPERAAEVLAAATTGTVRTPQGTLLVGAAPLSAPDGSPLGRVVLTIDVGELADLATGFTRATFVVAVLGLIASAVVAAAVSRRTTAPVGALTRAAERVAAGDLDVRVRADGPDEVGRLARAFDTMTVALAARDRELRAAAEVEAELRARLEATTRSMGEALIAVGPDGVVHTANPAAAALTGIPAERLIGRPLSAVLRGQTATGEPLHAALGGPDDARPTAVTGAVQGRDGLVPVAATAAPLIGADGTQRGRVYVLRDTSAEVEAERMKTQFLANVSHELRTPLTPIRGYAEVLRTRDVGRERTVEFATTIVASVARLERVIGMLVDYAALEAGRVEVSLQPTDLGERVDAALARWRQRHPDRTFRRRLARGLPPVRVDPTLLDRVLEELIDNAVKFSDGPVVITAQRVDRRRVALTVRDRGIGVPAERLDAITRDFEQADGSATRRYGGLGLGLAIVRRIADRVGAELRIDSEPGRGTDVHLLLPVARGGRR